MTVTIGSQAASNKPATAIDHQPAAIGNIHADARSSRSPPRSGRQIMDTPSPSTASTTAHAVGYNDEPSITAAPLRSTDDLAVDAGQLSSLILTTEATATPQRIVESVTSLTSSGILAEGQRMPTVRDLARLLRTSPATVSSAYHALARSGILRSRGRAGTFVLRQSRTHRYDAGDLLAEAPATAPDRPIIDLSKG
ncbi:GntR family transcriptional regulator, partial [Bifidobacterium longum]|nr:GntR family transcriptional regulator [Bifidobacterium longum]